MPARLDLAGRVFGRLMVIRANGRVKFGRWQTAWLCRCECGVEVTVPQDRLPHRPSVDDRHRVDACPGCRARPCVICGTPILPPSTAAACSPEHLAQHRRDTQLNHYYKMVELDPEFGARRQRMAKLRAEIDPSVATRQSIVAKRARRVRQTKINDDPSLRERVRAQARSTYAKHRTRILADRRTKLEAMTPEQHDIWIERMRKSGREYRRRWRAEIKADPQRHAEYIDLMREYRRQRALRDVLAIGAKLEKKL